MSAAVEQRMQEAAEQRLQQVQDAFWRLEENPDDLAAQDAAGWWCGGCDTCCVREVLEAAMPVLLEAIRSGEFDLAATAPMSNVHQFPGGRQ